MGKFKFDLDLQAKAIQRDPSGDPPGPETYQDWAERFFYGIPRDGTLTYKPDDDSLWFCDHQKLPSYLDTLDEFCAKIGWMADIIRTKLTPDGSWQEYPAFLRRPEANLLYRSPARAILPYLDLVVREPAVVGPLDRLELISPGYTEKHRIYYYAGPEGPIKPLESTKHLTECFSGVPFDGEIGGGKYRNNLIGWLLGAVYLTEHSYSPLMIITGNQQGVGKSCTQEACGYILTGRSPAIVDSEEGEFEKQVGIRFQQGDRVISMDNVLGGVKGYKNTRLSTFVTQGWSHNVRILGHSREIVQKGTLFVLNSNDARLHPDLATRCLPVKLYREVRTIMTPYVLDYAKAHRRELYGELLGLALSKPTPEPYHKDLSSDFRYRAWFNFVHPRILSAFGPMAIEEAYELDESTQELCSWFVNTFQEATPHNIAVIDIYRFMQQDSSRFTALRENYDVKSQRGTLTKLTNFLKGLVNKSLTMDSSVITFRTTPVSGTFELLWRSSNGTLPV